jgi:hypothetical protein
VEEQAELQEEVPSPLPQKRALWRLDLVLFLLLCFVAAPVRWQNSTGDFWFDEADYAHAAMKGFTANQWDRSDDPKSPLQMALLRHYHPPTVSYFMGVARRFGAEDRVLRIPFIVIGCLVVGMTYLCGIVLFRERREVAFGVALLVLVTPMQIRAGSHAIPWAPITLNLLVLLWTLLKFAETRKPRWILGIGITLGVLFTVSEIFLPAVLVVACCAPLLLFPEIRDAEFRKQVLRYVAFGTGLALLIGILLWPAGLTGGTLTMLAHYMDVSKMSVEHAYINGKVYDRAPRWAYFYWYWRDFSPYLVLYLVGFAGVPILAAVKKLSREAGVLIAYTLLFLGVAHKAHIIGPQYLAHCLPFMSLMTGLFVGILAMWKRPLGWVALAVAGFYVATLKNPNMIEDDVARIPRSPQAAAFLKTLWKPGDRMMIGTQQPTVILWYLREVEQMPVRWNEVVALPSAKKRDEVLEGLRKGEYRFFALANTFNSPRVDAEIQKIIAGWDKIYQSQEPEGTTPRFVLYAYRPSLRQ